MASASRGAPGLFPAHPSDDTVRPIAVPVADTPAPSRAIEGGFGGYTAAGSPSRAPAPLEGPRVHAYHPSDARALHRRQHRHLHDRPLRAASTLAVSRVG